MTTLACMTNIDDTQIYSNAAMLESNNICLERTSMDQRINSYGHKLLDMCKSNGIYIVNGKLELDKGVGKTTCKDASVVDYCLATVDLFTNITDFEILVLQQSQLFCRQPKPEN
jgi:hypothetical protein